MKLPADVIDQAKKVLGGKNVTAKRLKEMLADYARLKNGPDALERDALVSRQVAEIREENGGYTGQVDTTTEPFEPEGEALEPCPSVLRSPGGPGRPDLYCGLKVGHQGEHGYVEKRDIEQGQREFPLTVPSELVQQAAEATAATGLDPTTAAIIAELRALRQDISALRQPVTPQDKAEAIMGGKLPVSNISAGPVGYTGSAALPQGVWFKSPYGPPIEMKICGCESCPPHRKVHYYCPMCKSGPHEYQRYVGGAKTHLAPGATWGIQHVMCSPACWNNYLPLVDGRRRIQEGVPRPAPKDAPMPEFAGTTAGENNVQLPEARPYGSD